MKTRIICLGNTTLDRVWPVAHLPTASGKHRAGDYFEVGGGLHFNGAIEDELLRDMRQIMH